MKMKDSGIEWIGKIPQEWEYIRAKHVFVQSTEKGNTVLELLSATQNNGVVPKTTLEGVVQVSEDADLTTFKTVHKGDYVISLRSFQGGFEMSNYEGVITPAYTVFRAKTPINNQYFKMLFKCDGFISKMNSLTVGIREGKNIMFNDFADSYIPFPPIDKQQRIADFLDRKCTQIDKTIEKEQQVIEKLKMYKQSIITEVVTKGLNPNVPMKESGIDFLGNIPKHWIVSRFSFETWVRARLGWKGLKAQEYVEDGYIFLSTPNIKEAEIDFKNVNYINEERYQESPEIKLSVGDVLLAKDGSTLGTVNVVRYLPKEATVNSSIAVITPNNRLNGIYLMYLIKSDYIQTIIQAMKDGMGVPHLFQRDINKMHITVPPIEEQKQIALFLDQKCTKIDCFIKKKQMLIDKLSDYKKSLIYEAVTGKLEI